MGNHIMTGQLASNPICPSRQGDDSGRGGTEVLDRKRLAYFINCFPNFIEGMIYREVDALLALGCNVSTFSIRRPDPSEVPDEAYALRNCTVYILPVPVLQFVKAHMQAILRFPLGYWRMLWEVVSGTHEKLLDRVRSICHFAEAIVVLREVERRRITHVHAHWAVGSTTVAMVVARLLRLPFSFTAHAYDIWRERLLLPEKLRAANVVMTCTEYNRRHLIREYGVCEDKVHTVHHGLSLERFHRHRHQRNTTPIILSVGRLVEQKGYERLVEACAELRRRGVPFRCEIVGDGPLRRQLEAQIGAADIQDTVRLLGRIVGDRLLDAYERADVFALLCLEASDGDRDGIPNTLIEAMAMELPVVSTSYSGVPELVTNGETGLLVAPGDAVSAADAIAQLLRDALRREAMGRAGRLRVMHEFTTARSAAKLEALFADCRVTVAAPDA
jgi:glycosyltransferase involved in cell wall biosynthesis